MGRALVIQMNFPEKSGFWDRLYLRGRDVKKWAPQPVDLYLIKIESSENKKHPWSDHPLEEAEGIFRETYPAIAKHMLGPDYRDKLNKRADQGKYFWELRSCQYWNAFDASKIIIPAITSRPELSPDKTGFICNNKASIAIAEEPHFICAVCNSKIGLWFAKKVFATKQNDSNDYEPRYSSQFPIPPATEPQKAELSDLAAKCAAAKQSGHTTDLQFLESQIDKIVYELFELTVEERAIISDCKSPATSITGRVQCDS